jgi:pimeloyl-ACP methyl ester carboxylesterase
MVVCLLDNRGVGDSSAPQRKDAYSTTAMAQDVLAVMVSC